MALNNFSSYTEALTAWLASNCQDKSQLLQGKALEDAKQLVGCRSLSEPEYQFLIASQTLEQQELLKQLEVARQKTQDVKQQIASFLANARTELATPINGIISSQLQTIQNNRQKRNELIEKWDNALLTLHELGWQIEFDPDTYLESIEPSWKREEIQHIEGKRRPRNWLELWLEAYVIIKPTPKIQTKLEAINGKALPAKRVKRRKSKKSSKDTNRRQIPGWVLAKALELKGWSYAHLAEQLGVHKSLPGKWIRGDRKIQPMHLQLIWQWLDSELHQVLGSQSI